jgi:hypothetical protein
MVVLVCNLSTQEAEVKISLDYIVRPHLKKTKTKVRGIGFLYTV